MGINALSKKVVVTQQPEGGVGIDVDETKIPHQRLIGAGKNTHVAIDDHLSSNLNPHSVRAEQTGAVPVTTKDKPGGVPGLDNTGCISEDCIPQSIARYDSVSLHKNDNGNPHEVSIEQLGAVGRESVGRPDGVAGLDGSGRLPKKHLPKDVLYSGDLRTHGSGVDNPHKVTAAQVGAVPASDKGRPNGIAVLNGYGKIDIGVLPDVLVHRGEFFEHSSDEGNPHKLNADQVGAVSKSVMGAPGGVAVLDSSGVIPDKFLPKSVVVESRYVEHVENTNNPHGIKPVHIGAVPSSSVGSNNGVAPLDQNGNVPDTNLPDFVVRYIDFNSHTENASNPHNVTAEQTGAVNDSSVGEPGGVAPLDNNGYVPDDFIPPTAVRAAKFKEHAESVNNPHRLDFNSVGAVGKKQVGAPNGVASLSANGKLNKVQVPTYLVTRSLFDSHAEAYDNPHNITPEQVKCRESLWNANKLLDRSITEDNPKDGQVLRWSDKEEKLVYDYETKTGEINTGDNLGEGSACFFAGKEDSVLYFRRIRPSSNLVSVCYSDDDDYVDIDVNPVNIDHDVLRNSGNNNHGVIDSHLSSTDNPHRVTSSQVGNDIAQWNADSIMGRKVSTATPADGQILRWDASSSKWVPTNEAAVSAETNTAVNVGNKGAGLFKRKKDAVLEFKRIVSLSNKLEIKEDEKNSRVTFGLNEDTIVHDRLSGAGKISHEKIDLHLGSSKNPHNVTPKQIGCDKPEWNANRLNGVYVQTAGLEDGSVLVFNKKLNMFECVNILELIKEALEPA